METREHGVTDSNIMPRGNNVIIKMIATASVMEISSGKYGEETNAGRAEFIVSGIGPLVPTDLEIGDKVALQITQAYHEVRVDGNFNSIFELQKLYKSIGHTETNKLIQNKDTAKVQVVQYGLFPEFMIKAVIK